MKVFSFCVLLFSIFLFLFRFLFLFFFICWARKPNQSSTTRRKTCHQKICVCNSLILCYSTYFCLCPHEYNFFLLLKSKTEFKKKENQNNWINYFVKLVKNCQIFKCEEKRLEKRNALMGEMVKTHALNLKKKSKSI